MNFDQLQVLAEKSERLAFCLSKCREAEMYARINPGICAAAARVALEKLMTDHAKANGLRPQNLSQSIEQNCRRIVERQEELEAMAHEIREAGNKAVHPKVAYVDAATRENVEFAISICQKLFELICYFEDCSGEFEPMAVPFCDLAIDHKIQDAGNLDHEKYIVHREGGAYYYLQCLSLQEELESRRLEANNLAYNQLDNRRSRILLPDTEQFMPDQSDRKILLYKIYPNSILLCELTQKLHPKDALDIGMELCDGLLELAGMGMSHRCLYPGNILLERQRNGTYDAYILDLRTSKIRGSNATVQHKLAAAWDNNYYIPQRLRYQDTLPPDTPWDKVDAYALCRLVLFCMDRQLPLATETGKLREYANTWDVRFSEEFLNLYKIVFSPNPKLEKLPDWEELKRIFEHAIT